MTLEEAKAHGSFVHIYIYIYPLYHSSFLDLSLTHSLYSIIYIWTIPDEGLFTKETFIRGLRSSRCSNLRTSIGPRVSFSRTTNVIASTTTLELRHVPAANKKLYGTRSQIKLSTPINSSSMQTRTTIKPCHQRMSLSTSRQYWLVQELLHALIVHVASKLRRSGGKLPHKKIGRAHV